MNNLYQWQDEMMARCEMQDLRRELDHIYLLNDASCTRQGWLACRLARFGEWLAVLGERIRIRYASPARRSYQTANGKFAA